MTDRTDQSEAKNLATIFLQECRSQIKDPKCHMGIKQKSYIGWTHDRNEGEKELANYFRYMKEGKQGWSLNIDKESGISILRYDHYAKYIIDNMGLSYIYNHGGKFLSLVWGKNGRLIRLHYIEDGITNIKVRPHELFVSVAIGDDKQTKFMDTNHAPSSEAHMTQDEVERKRKSTIKEMNAIFPVEISKIITSYVYPKLDQRWLLQVIRLKSPAVPNLTCVDPPSILPIPQMF